MGTVSHIFMCDTQSMVLFRKVGEPLGDRASLEADVPGVGLEV